MNLAAPVTLLTAAVTILALILYMYMGINVGRMRTRHGIKAPVMTGHADFERANRVQINTLENLPVFVIALWLAALYFTLWGWAVPILGLFWVIGRYLYLSGYMADPDKRGTGFGIATFSQLGLLILAIAGVVMAWTATA